MTVFPLQENRSKNLSSFPPARKQPSQPVYENSTRLSFKLAEKPLAANPLNFSTSTSSVNKGETFKDTFRNIAAMKIDMVVVRHRAAGVPTSF
ncbi:MAG: hypothetical protein ACLFSB_07390 [Chitinispirillaceae bacterium]